MDKMGQNRLKVVNIGPKSVQMGKQIKIGQNAYPPYDTQNKTTVFRLYTKSQLITQKNLNRRPKQYIYLDWSRDLSSDINYHK